MTTSAAPTIDFSQPTVRDQHVEREPISPAVQQDRRLKEWALLAPDGTEHRFRNLAAFLRQHAGFFNPDDLVSFTKTPGGPSRAYLGLSRLRPEHSGRRSLWQGWRWADPVPPRPPTVRKGGAWALRAPDGSEHRFQNLSAFVLTNPSLFDPADLAPYGKGQECRATISLRQLRPKPENRHKSWNGWEWIS